MIHEATTRLLNADQVAELLSVKRTWVYQAARDGRIASIRLGRYVRFRAEDVEQAIAEHRSPAPSSRGGA